MRLTRLTAALLPLLLSHFVAAQTTESKTKAPSKTTFSKNTANSETAEQQRLRRSQARSLLMALSTDARTFTDPSLRARSLARIADALWQVDAEQGRLMFRKSWEAAEVADQENDQKMQQEIDRQKAKTGGSVYALNTPPKIRREVLVLAARHDRTLSEEFLEKLKAQTLEAANNLKDPGPYGLSEALSQRINVARDLMQAGEIERALEFADAALTVVSIDTVSFLSDLREKAPGPADNRYAAMLTSAAANPQSDGNTASLLSSYIFTPHLFIIFRNASSTNTSQRSDKVVPADVSPELRLAFFQAAAVILLRPITAAAIPNTNVTEAKAVDPNDIESRYLVIKRLLPFFEQSAPTELTESLRAQLNTMNAMVSEQARRRDDEWLSKGIKPDKPAADQEQALLDRADRAKTSAERDSVYIQLAFLLARRGDMRARDYVSKVDDAEQRKGVQAYIDPFLAGYFIQKKLTDQALEMATKGELTHVQRAWVLTECAKLLQKTDRDKASELIEGAATEARRIDVSDPFLPRALLAVANAVALIDPPRVWDATFDAVKAANSATGFSGEDGELVYSFRGKSQSSISSSSVSEFDVEGIFKQLATLDYERAVELARGFEVEGPRAVATIAIARAILEPTKKASAVKN